MSRAWCEAHNTVRAAAHEDQENYATRNENGTGPFMLKDRQPTMRTVLVKNPNWWGEKNWPIDLDEVVFTRVEKRGDQGRCPLIGRARHGLQRAPARHRADP